MLKPRLAAYLAVPKARLERRRGSAPRFANFESLVSDPTAGEPAPSGHPIVAEAIAPIEVEPAIAMLKKRSSGTRASDAGCGRSKRRVHSAPVACAYVAMHKSDLRAVGDDTSRRRSLSPLGQPRSSRALGRRSGRHDPTVRWRRRTSRIRPRASSGRRRVGADALQPSHAVADLLDPRFEPIRAWRDAPFAEGRARINTQAASTGRNRCSSAARGSAPTTRSISCPSRITTSNGIDCAPNLVASPGFASTSTFTTFRCPA